MTSGPELLGTEKEKRAPVPAAVRAERAGRWELGLRGKRERWAVGMGKLGHEKGKAEQAEREGE